MIEVGSEQALEVDQLNSQNSELKLHTCFICNIETYFIENIKELRSQHSDTNVFILVQKCLGKSKIHRNFDEDVNESVSICGDCLLKINEYDLACVTAERVAVELRQLLIHTDSIYSGYEFKMTSDLVIGSITETIHEDDTGAQEVEVEAVEEIFNDDINEVVNEATECSDSESSYKEAQIEEDKRLKNVIKNKRTYECDFCPRKFDSWKDSRVSWNRTRSFRSFYDMIIQFFDNFIST